MACSLVHSVVSQRVFLFRKLPCRRALHSRLSFRPFRCDLRLNRSDLEPSVRGSVGRLEAVVQGRSTGEIMAGKSKIDASLFAGAMPKEEIGALRFLKDHPEYDGRGVVVAIFDTGVDPGAAGLQVTSDGKQKIVDVVDCTGSGDVITSKIVKADDDGCIKGLTGTSMKLNPDWVNPSGEWRVGSKRAFELFPAGLVKRMKEHRLKKWQEKQRVAVTEANAALAKFEAEHPKTEDEALKKEKGELESRVKLLQSMMEKYEDLGPVFECVVWNDGENWRAAIDTSDMYEEGEGSGLLADFEPLTNFRVEKKFGTFSTIDMCNFACNIYDDGDILSIVVDCSTHGTHCAGIVAANHPDEPELNGIAPGAQIVSCKIGDTRLGSMECGPGLTRAVIAALENKVDVCNMSYGEMNALPNSGRFIDLLNDLVNKFGVPFVTSAGNSGPALTTIGGPGSSEPPFSVGAYVSPKMAEVAHSLREKIDEGQQYTFTSRGPTADGALGLSFAAPGGAIAPVPQWTTQARQLMNGTSMASPNACGGVALLLSGLKDAGGAISPNRLRRALENSCQEVEHGDIPSPLTYGRGLLQIDKAWEYLEKSGDVDFPDVRYSVRVQRSDGGALDRGIYVREPAETTEPLTWHCWVTPKFHEDADIKTEKLVVEDRLAISCTGDWISCPDVLLLPSIGRSFEIKVDSAKLPEGVHYGEVQGFDVTARWRGPVFRIPVTVVQPSGIPEATNGDVSTSSLNHKLGTFKFTQGKEHRRFITIPPEATWAEVTIKAGQHDGTPMYFADLKQLLTDVRTDTYSTAKRLAMPANAIKNISCKVAGGGTLELAIAQYWSSLPPSELEIEVDFHAVDVVQGNHLHLDGAAGNMAIQVVAPLRREVIKPAGKLDTLVIAVRPTESKVEPFPGHRDTLPDSRVLSKLSLTYKLTVTEAGKFTPKLPIFNRQVYDSEVEGQMVQIFDSNKKLLVVSDIYPETVDLKKGDYIIKALVRHEKPDFLEKYKDLPMMVERKLEKPVTVPIYTTRRESAKAGTTFKEKELSLGQMVNMVLGPVTDETPKDATTGTVLNGTLTLGQLLNGKNSAPATVKLSYTVPPPKASNNNNGGASKDEEKSPKEKVTEAVRDAKIKVLEGLKLDGGDEEKAYNALLEELEAEFPKHLPLLSAALKKLDGLETDKRLKRLDEIVDAADKVIAAIDETELACFLARKTPEEGEGAAKRSKEMNNQKTALVEALEKKLSALMDMEEDKKVDEKIEKTFAELRKWVDTMEAPYATLHARRESHAGRYAEAIKALDKVIASDDKLAAKKVYEMRAEYMGKLGWAHWEKHQETAIYVNFPTYYAPF